MANNSPIIGKEVATLEPPPPSIEEDQKPKTSTPEPVTSTPRPKFELNINVAFSCTFNIPSTAKALVRRVCRNIVCFKAYYDVFIWAVLVLALIPNHKFSLLLVLINTVIMVAYLRLSKAFPNSTLLRRWIDKPLVWNCVVQGTVVEMFLTGAGYHMFFTFVATYPIIWLHAVLNANEEYSPVVSDQADDPNANEEYNPVVSDQADDPGDKVADAV